MPLVQTRGAASAQGFGEFAQAGPAVNYIEDVFSTFLYTGISASLTITNNIDLSGKGGMVWIKRRSSTARDNILVDTVRGANNWISSNLTNASAADSSKVSSFTSSGFVVGSDGTTGQDGETYCSWTFREQAKFFDVVTYSGSGASNQNVSHNLGSVPGMMIVKRTDSAGQWYVYHRVLGNTAIMTLNSTNIVDYQPIWGNTTPTSTVFTVGGGEASNTSGGSYVAYLFADGAGGFGVSGTEDVIGCGSYAGSGSGGTNTINLGFEPQFVLIKSVDLAEGWLMFDNTRGIFNGNDSVGVGTDPYLQTNVADAEQTASNFIRVTSTGFVLESGGNAINNSSSSYIYMAIRRGPMKTPTSGTQVFSPVARSGTGSNATIASGFLADTVIEGNRTSSTAGTKFGVWDRQRKNRYLNTNTTAAEISAGTTLVPANPWDVMDGYKVGTTSTLTNASGSTFIDWIFKRAPGFHDLVCWTGNSSSNQTVNHNLGTAPELIITKSRGSVTGWLTYAASQGVNKYALFNTTGAFGTITNFWPAAPTSTTFNIDMTQYGGAQSSTMVAYLFATLAGISKVGSYSGTGATQTINCGFTGGARFVLIKRSSDSGGWYVWDTARGMVAGTDPFLALNTADAETNLNTVYTIATGFQIVGTDPELNASGSTYIFLAIA